MNLEIYQKLTGVTVPESQQTAIKAQINRTRSILEDMLGFTLCADEVNKNLYNEEGKTALECACPDVDTEDLQDPDEVEYAYRLYSYNDKDRFFHVDPFTELYKVKLVHDGVTVKTFDADETRVNYGRFGLAKYIEACRDCLCFELACGCTDCVQLAVDAKWLWEDCLPKDLKFVWAEMVTYYNDCKKDVKSETVGSHSYTKFDRRFPENEPANLSIIKRYAGPYGSVTRTLTV